LKGVEVVKLEVVRGREIENCSTRKKEEIRRNFSAEIFP